MTTFRTLLAAHLAADPAEATLVLAGVAPFHGLKANGDPMVGEAAPTAPTLRQVAAELGVHVGVVRRGVRHLVAAGVVTVAAGIVVTPEALRARWAARSATIALSVDLRALGLRSEPLLLAGVVADNLDQRGRLVLGIQRFCARTGIPRRSLQRALAIAEATGALHRWTIPGRWVLCCAPGPRREVAQENRREVAPENTPPVPPRREVAQEKAENERREVARPPSRSGAPPVAKWRDPRREVAHATPDCSGVPRIAPDARVRAREPRADRSAEPEPAAEPDTKRVELDPVFRMQSVLMRTTVRDLLPPFERLKFFVRLAKALVAGGMTPEECEALWNLAKQKARGDDPAGLFLHWLAGTWRDVLEEGPSKDRHAAAMARGRAAQGRHEGQPIETPVRAGELLEQVMARARQA